MSLEVNTGDAGELVVTPRWLSIQTEVPYSLQVAEIAFFVRLARLATREHIKAHRVILPQLPSSRYLRRYENFFGVPVQKGEYPVIAFAAVDALRPFLTVNESMFHAFEPDLRRRLSELDSTASTAERVRAVLLELLPGNAATIEKAAERLGLSKRTLQRRLEEEGKTFAPWSIWCGRALPDTTWQIPQCPAQRSLSSLDSKIPIPFIAHSRGGLEKHLTASVMPCA